MYTPSVLTNVMSVLSLLTLWIRAMLWYPQLPAKIPIHFNGSGLADGFVERSWASWLALPTIGTLIAAGLFVVSGPGLSYLARRWPRLVNIPDKERWLTLDESARVRTFRGISTALKIEGVFMLVLFLWIQESSARVAIGEWTQVPIWPVFLMPLCTLVVMPWALINTARAVEHECEAAQVQD